MTEPTTPTVFISYSQDSDEHKDSVLELANRLRADGIDAVLDQYETSPAEGWLKWMDRHIADDDFVLVVCTEKYHRRVIGKEETGKGLGIKWESTLTYQRLYDDDSLNTRFIPIMFDGGKTENIPTPIKGGTFYFLPSQYDKLYRHITNQPETPKPELGKLKPLLPRERKTDFSKKVSLDKLPSTNPITFGRDGSPKQLDEAWENREAPSSLILLQKIHRVFDSGEQLWEDQCNTLLGYIEGIKIQVDKDINDLITKQVDKRYQVTRQGAYIKSRINDVYSLISRYKLQLENNSGTLTQDYQNTLHGLQLLDKSLNEFYGF
ncbi:MAG: TIR domain-containing protein [Anaerolineaceae bacterium]|nr:MAG: TIR domain-containing protein [Anaerolineaceae bacterium]